MQKSEMIKFCITCLMLLMETCALATASVTSLNNCPDMIFIDGNEHASIPSAGKGGGSPGSFSRTITFNAASHTYYYYIPTSYTSNQAMPMMALWHGAVFAGGGPAAALDMIDYWQAEAEAQGFILVAQAAIGSPGCEVCGWLPSADSQKLAAILDDMEARYNIETTRRYAWGFSAGGFVMHAIGLNSADYFAAYAVSGAHLGFAVSAGYPPSSAVRNLPVYISVGTADSHYTAASSDITAFIAAGWVYNQDIWFDDFVGGHELTIDLPAKAWNKICIATNLN